MKQRVVFGLLGLALVGLGAATAYGAEEATNGRERFFLKRQNCPWTEEMGKYIFECIKKNDGFNAHWCHNEAIDAFCPADESAIPHPTDVLPGQKPAEPVAGKKG
ncbi:MAG TPA: hypothetical protein VF523_07920 [Burkholderiales bacterium]